ncbi:bifunctional UDP-N-acetylglucosamine diphosphorylase/glucosamine-1-phosphate N-acetyltransferase GlmU [Oricola thermophila]|uniref:Bifunctional protein GlmU n=1 Tax=Oricola thermophila TaxID=2742145 RepID=A0A6N1VAZ4_9HYPH|nr:bifunctional UDP-N-acetylglucosamine diphosphorylase/glucosamine-1-phosphate N-acetyltransferase GlmU [Oricola thermophila]QKV18126.1 bifunctional UDP-N-acetylglucosamine diphosphorylase/glucosamine-1-phosphate N-acetyltransferase GlmU [Oricola thermophila]
MARSCLTIILAAGQGTRMKSALPKVLHPVAGLPMAAHVARTAQAAGSESIAVVIGHGGAEVRQTLSGMLDGATFHEQDGQLGTAHAVLAARDSIAKGYDDVLVMFGDTPLVRPGVMRAARARLAEGASVAVVGFRPADPSGYGRLIERDGELVAIREDREANDEERRIGFCNGGIMAFSGDSILELLNAVGNDNAKGEYYMTDAVEIARSLGRRVVAIEAPVEDVVGVNTRRDLAAVEAIWQHRARCDFLDSGVTMLAPDTVFLHHDTKIEPDAIIEPNVVFGPGVEIKAGARIRSFSYMEGAVVGENAEIGPFARLRPGARLSEKSKVGNFCEVKNSEIGEGAKVNHLTYVGDSVVGPRANLGAGTITCNYDGYGKHLTEIGANAFVGSNTSLVAPVRIGDNAYIASGSVVTDEVPDDAVAFARSRQINKEGLAPKLRARFKAAKEAKKG